MTLTVQQAESFAILYYICVIGSVISVVALLSILINMIFHYINIFIRSKDYEQDKTVYILFIIACTLSIFHNIPYTFIKSNLLTRQSAETITESQCIIGHFIAFTSITFLQPVLYSLLIYRVQLTFNGSIYAYPKTLYRILYLILIIVTIACLILLYIDTSATPYVLYYLDSTNHTYCGTYSDPNSSQYITYSIGSTLFVVTAVIYDIVLLYMFTKRLYLLQKELVKQFMSEKKPKIGVVKEDSIDIKNKTGSNQKNKGKSSPIELVDAQDQSQGQIVHSSSEDFNFKQRTLTIEDVISESNNKNNYAAKRIISLHKLIKQQTILLTIVIVVSIIWLLLEFVSDWFYLGIPMVILLYNICIWLMFASSYKYWKFTTNYCCCYICYYNKKRDINSRTCFLFC